MKKLFVLITENLIQKINPKMTFYKDLKMSSLVKTFIVISSIMITSNFSQTDSRLNDFLKNTEFKSAEDLLNQIRTHEHTFFKQGHREKLQLFKLNEEKISKLDSAVAIRLASFDENETNLDTVKFIITYLTREIGYIETQQILKGKIWINKYRSTFVYNKSYKTQNEIHERWIENKWEPYERTKYVYYPDGKNDFILSENYKNNKWEFSSRATSEYDALGHRILGKYEYWRNGKWEIYYRDILKYDGKNLVLDLRESSGHGFGSSYTKSEYTYNDKNLISTYHYETSTNGKIGIDEGLIYYYDDQDKLYKIESLVNNKVVKRALYEFGMNGFMEIETNQVPVNDQWTTNLVRTTISDNKGNTIKLKRDTYENGLYKLTREENYTYDVYGRLLTYNIAIIQDGIRTLFYREESRYSEIYKGESRYFDNIGEKYFLSERLKDGEWTVEKKRSAEYDSDGNRINGIAEKWQKGWLPSSHYLLFIGPDGSARWGIDYYKLNAYYSEKGPWENINNSDTELLQNYPNPFNNLTRINFILKNDSHVKLEIFDILGKKVKELINTQLEKGIQGVDFNSSGLASGIYFYRIITDGYTGTKKMIILK